MLGNPAEFEGLAQELKTLEATSYLPPVVAGIVNNPRSLLILSIPKCGTTWLRYLLTHYAVQCRRPGAPRVPYWQLRQFGVDRYFARGQGEEIRQKFLPFLPEQGLDYFLYEHPRRDKLLEHDIAEHGGPKLLAHRNVLDFLVSNYYYFYEYRDNACHLASHPRDLIPSYTRYWALCWRWFHEKVMPAGRATLISYDELQRDTFAELKRALEALAINVDDEALKRAIPLSTSEHTGSDEKQVNFALVGRIDRGSFVRDGSVGQWRTHFTDEEVQRVADILAESGVDPAAVLPSR